MNDQAPSTQSTLVVLLGASEWPSWPDLNQELSQKELGNANTFKASATGVKDYFLAQEGFDLPEENLLDLFNKEYDVGQQTSEIGSFLEKRISILKDAKITPTHLIIYYVGHGGFNSKDFYFAIRTSKKDSISATSLEPKNLAEVIKNKSRQLRCYLIIDCCYAGAAEKDFEQVPINGGVSLIGSSASNKTSQATHNEKYTMFSGALLQVLQKGNEAGSKWFSLRQLKKAVTKVIRHRHHDKAVIPIVLSPVPSESGEDIAELPLFSNVERRTPTGDKSFIKKEDFAQCYVIESATEERLQLNTALGSTVGSALGRYKDDLEAVINKPVDINPVVVSVDWVIASPERLENTVKALCQAEIAVFDVTDYESAVMLMLGIRSVVRRGVTIASYGGNYTIGGPLNYPFSIKEVNIVSHSNEQLENGEDPIVLIGQKIIAGFEQLRNIPSYLDLPVFDAIRTLPPDREQRIPKEYTEQVLVLCSFSQHYTNNNWKHHLKRHLPTYLQNDKALILRTLDLKSTRLVSQSLYEAMRLTLMCIVDWTEWRPNVFFELGVRLASVDTDPVCIIETKHKNIIEDLSIREEFDEQNSKAQAWLKDNNVANEDKADYTTQASQRLAYTAYQRRRLLEMFDPIDYKMQRRITDQDKIRYRDMVQHHKQLIEDSDEVPRSEVALPPSFIYRIVSKFIDINMEGSTFPVYDELIQTADLLSDPQKRSAGRSVVLYPENAFLSRKVDEGATELRLAAWHYINNRLRNELENNNDLLKKYIDLSNLLSSALLRSPREDDQEMAKIIRQQVKKYKNLQK
ncbi:MAG: caspase family protein [Cyanobacteria bacterium P01_G01_bin.39]